jgi:restriction system protein
MARRRESVFDLLALLPWWVAALFGFAGYAAITLVPPLIVTHRVLAPAAQGLRPVGLIWLGVCAFAGVVSVLRSLLIRRVFDRQRGLDDIRKLSWRQFEPMVCEAFRRRDYSVLENSTGGADEGVDLVLRKGGETFFVQCRQWKAWKVGVKPIRELLDVITAGDASGGFFVSSGTYTTEAREFAKSSALELIDGEGLAQMIEEARVPEPFLDPTLRMRDETISARIDSATPSCPSCGDAMVRRVAQRGAKAGSEFWGCMQYPRCRGIRSANG